MILATTAANWSDSQDARQTSVAYCGYGGQIVQRTSTRPVPSNERASATAKCPRGDGVAFGGFTTTFANPSLDPEDYRIIDKTTDKAVEMPAKYELVINTSTAKAPKLAIPPRLLALADEVIE